MTSASLSELLPPDQSRRTAAFFLAVGAVAIGIYFLLPSDGQDVHFVAIGLAGVGGILVGSRKLGAGRIAWRLLALGLLFKVLADAVTNYYEIALGHEPPLPSVADLFYLAGYPLMVVGIFLLLRERGPTNTRAGVLDTVIVFAAVATVQWMLLVEPYRHADLGTGARLTSMAYPVMDVLLFVGLAQLMVGVGRKTLAYWFLLASVGLWIIGDENFAFAAGSYASGRWTDVFWLGSYVLWGAAALALSQRDGALSFEQRSVPRLTKGRLALLALALLAVPVTLIAEQQYREHAHPTAAAIGFVVIAVLVLVRLSGLVRLVEQARLDERKARNDAEQARERIEEQNAQLLELDRLKDELLSNVSHELRTPLTSITGYVELLLEETVDPQERRHLEIVQRNTARLLALVSDLLFAALLQSGHLELHLGPVDLCELVDHAAESARPHAEAGGVSLRVRADDVPLVDGQRDRLAQLLDNLVSNAIKFTPSGGEVVVSLEARNGDVLIEVADTGIGLTEDERAQVFGRFYRADSAGRAQIPGTGLGLYIAKAIVDAHGGRIDVKCPPSGGTVFMVELPASSAQPSTEPSLEAPGLPEHTRG